MALKYAGKNPDNIAGIVVLMSGHKVSLIDNKSQEKADNNEVRISTRPNPNEPGGTTYAVPYDTIKNPRAEP